MLYCIFSIKRPMIRQYIVIILNGPDVDVHGCGAAAGKCYDVVKHITRNSMMD